MDNPALDVEVNKIGADIGAVRRQRLVHAVVASTTSKILAFAVQLLAFPLALHSLGTDRYASFLALQAFLSWTGLCGLGISMSLPKFVAAANVAEDRVAERGLVITALALMGGASVAVMLVLAVLGLVISPSAMLATSLTVSPQEMRTAYWVAAALSAAQLFASIEGSVRSGYQELYRSSICAIVASLFFVLPGLLYLGGHRVTITPFIVVIYAPLVVLFLIDLALLLRQRPYLYRGPIHFRNSAKLISAPSGNALAFQVEYALIVYLPTLVVAHMASAAQTAAFGSILQLLGLGAASLNLFFQPLMSAIANAHSHGDWHWIQRNYKRVFLLIGLAGLLVLLTAATVGPFLIRHWLGRSIEVSRPMLAFFGAYFLFLSISLFQFYVLSAMGALKGTGVLYLLQGALSLFLGALLCFFFGATGMVLGLAVGVAATIWMLPLKVFREITSMKNASG